MSHAFERFEGLVPLARLAQLKVTIIGAGATGAAAALALAKMGIHQMEVWDFDAISIENVGTQLYTEAQAKGKRPKVLALKDLLERQAHWLDFTAVNRRFEDGDEINGDVVIAALDRLDGRKLIWRTLQRNPGIRCALIDPRIGAEAIDIFTVNPLEDGGWYEPTLEGQPYEAPCTMRGTFHVGAIAGGLVAAAVKAWVVGEVAWPRFTLDVRNFVSFGMTRNQLLACSRKAA